jgi:tetraacyldisaccharide 4'-kinase
VGPHGEEELNLLKGKKVLALSGIANPDSFSSLLRKCGMEIVSEAIFPDHHSYIPKDLSTIKEKSKGADWIVTTEKDMLKLRTLGIDHLPIRSLRIEMRIWEEEDFFKRVISLF